MRRSSLFVLAVLFSLQLSSLSAVYADESAPGAGAGAGAGASRAILPGKLAPSEISGLTNPEHIQIVSQCNKDINELSEQGRYGEALAPAYKVLEITQSDLGSEHLEVASALNNVGWLEQSQGDYVKARQLFSRAQKIIESRLGPQDPKVAYCLNNLASLSRFQGDFDSALSLYKRALAISEKSFGNEDTMVASIIKSIAGVLDAQGKKDEALLAYERALTINKKALNADSPDLADSLNDYAYALQDRQRYSEAIPLLEQALAIREKALGPLHPEIAETLNNIAMVHRNAQHFELARPLLERALTISRKSVGPEHLDVANLLNNLGEIAWLENNLPQAQDDVLQAAAIIDLHIKRILPALSFAEQQAFIDTRIPLEVNRLLVACRQGQPLIRAYSIMFRWKGLLVDSLKRQVAIAHLAESKNCKAQLARLQKVRSEIAGWYLAAGTVPYQQWKSKNDEITSEKESIERELADALKSGLMEDVISGADLRDFQKLLRSDESFVDIYEYNFATPTGESTRHYVALVIGPFAAQASISLVDLGPTTTVNSAIGKWRQAVSDAELAEPHWQYLQKILWSPLKSAIPAATTRLWICPDGKLSCVPWQLLPEIEKGNLTPLIAQLDSPRELFHMRARELAGTNSTTDRSAAPAESNSSSATPAKIGASTATPEQSGEKPVLLLLGNASFNSDRAFPVHSGNLVKQPFVFKELPATLKELNSIKEIAARQGFATEVLTGVEATKEALLAKLHLASYVHLATHGFFINQDTINLIKPKSQTGTPAARAEAEGTSAASRNPLIESGVALAGANLKDPVSSQNYGLLTAEELIGEDFNQCSLMALSACETGRGEETTGQGVMGLRAAMIASGARNVIMSVWKVPDLPTSRLMEIFYRNLWEKHLPAARALAAAQLETAKLYSAPVCWAGWVLVGQGW